MFKVLNSEEVGKLKKRLRIPDNPKVYFASTFGYIEDIPGRDHSLPGLSISMWSLVKQKMPQQEVYKQL